MKYVVAIGLSIASLALAYMQEISSSKQRVSSSIGLKVGQNAPAFAFRDQFGHEQSIETLKGSNGAVLLFFRSAAILDDFAERHKIDFPLLADPDSKIIVSFNVLNAEATGKNKGMAHPGFFYIDSGGVIREKYFERKYTERFTPNNVIGKLFPELTEEVSQKIEAPHLRLTLEQSDRDVVPGSRVSLIAEIELPPDTHVYSPGVQGYKPIQLAVHKASGIELAPITYPVSKDLFLEAIQEHVLVFEGKFRIIQDVTIDFSPASDIVRSLVSEGKTISISGELRYQACDKTVCYPPTSLPVMWSLKVFPLDLKRSPEAIRH